MATLDLNVVLKVLSTYFGIFVCLYSRDLDTFVPFLFSYATDATPLRVRYLRYATDVLEKMFGKYLKLILEYF